jgi:hypothetical protein
MLTTATNGNVSNTSDSLRRWNLLAGKICHCVHKVKIPKFHIVTACIADDNIMCAARMTSYDLNQIDEESFVSLNDYTDRLSFCILFNDELIYQAKFSWH